LSPVSQDIHSNVITCQFGRHHEPRGALSPQFNQRCLPIDLRHYGAIAIPFTRASAEDCRSLEDPVVPMCQSPRIADVLLRAQQVPANDNRAALQKPVDAPVGVFRATGQTILIVGCAVALLLL
jgi:hypothetical protein